MFHWDSECTILVNALMMSIRQASSMGILEENISYLQCSRSEA